jgi:hypothetical protein
MNLLGDQKVTQIHVRGVLRSPQVKVANYVVIVVKFNSAKIPSPM